MACVTKRRKRWVIDYYDNQGKRQRQTLKEGTTKKKAKEKLREIEDQLDKGLYIPESKIPAFKQVAEDWLNYKKPNLRASTWSVYEGHTKKHFLEFEKIKINLITAAMIEKWIADRQAQNIPIGTIRKVMVSMGQIFRYAARHKYISYNPFMDAERPSGKTKNNNIKILTPDKINSLLNAVADQKYRTLFKLAIMSGARQGELLGLKWSDIDWKNSQIHIQRTFNNQKWYNVKTETSNRKIDIGPAMLAELKKMEISLSPE